MDCFDMRAQFLGVKEVAGLHGTASGGGGGI